ncbi:isoprenyl transferase, partial [Clostridium perfringens]
MIKRVRAWVNQEDSQQTHQLSPDNIPHHVAIIMDGNGR